MAAAPYAGPILVDDWTGTMRSPGHGAAGRFDVSWDFKRPNVLRLDAAAASGRVVLRQRGGELRGQRFHRGRCLSIPGGKVNRTAGISSACG